jgi:hypothetical protein
MTLLLATGSHSKKLLTTVSAEEAEPSSLQRLNVPVKAYRPD